MRKLINYYTCIKFIYLIIDLVDSSRSSGNTPVGVSNTNRGTRDCGVCVCVYGSKGVQILVEILHQFSKYS